MSGLSDQELVQAGLSQIRNAGPGHADSLGLIYVHSRLLGRLASRRTQL